MDVTRLDVSAAARLIASGELSPVELTQGYLDRIERHDGQVNAYVTVTAEQALAQARRLADEAARGHVRGPLHGIPVGLKDNIDTAGIPTTAASRVFADRVPDADAPVVTRLADAGAVLLGKLNMHEFAYGGTSAISAFGPVRNPWNLGRTPGGSSGGSAAAVAAGLCAVALGTDTAASVRYPAACCGVVGLKATHGLASIRGIVPLSEGHDHVGPLARTVADAATVMAALAGYDSRDPVSRDVPVPDIVGGVGRRVDGLRIGVPRVPFWDELDPEVEHLTAQAIELLAGLTGIEPVDVELPAVDSVPFMLAEIYAYHADLVGDPATRARYDPETLRRIMDGAEIPAHVALRSERAMRLARNTAGEHFADVDVMVAPCAARPSLEIDRVLADIPDERPLIRNTVPFDTYGVPTISVPCGFTDGGLPVGLQIAAAPLREATVIALAHAYEQATDWHRVFPPIA